MEQEEKDLKV